MSTIDGSPKLERQVQKLTIQMNHQIPDLKAAGYFTLGRNMILKTLGVAVIFTYFMVQFEKIKMMKSWEHLFIFIHSKCYTIVLPKFATIKK